MPSDVECQNLYAPPLVVFTPFHVPSRLKGIETFLHQPFRELWRRLSCTFPFEGNGNPPSLVSVFMIDTTAFPVPSRLKGMETRIPKRTIRRMV